MARPATSKYKSLSSSDVVSDGGKEIEHKDASDVGGTFVFLLIPAMLFVLLMVQVGLVSGAETLATTKMLLMYATFIAAFVMAFVATTMSALSVSLIRQSLHPTKANANGTRSNLVAASLFFTYVRSAFVDFGTFIVGGMYAVVTAARRGRVLIVLGMLLVVLAAFIEDRPIKTVEFVIGVVDVMWKIIWYPVALVGGALALIVEVFVGAWNVLGFWWWRNIITQLWIDSDECVVRFTIRFLENSAVFLVEFIEEFVDWAAAPYDRVLDFSGPYTSLQLSVVDARSVLGCACKSLDFVLAFAFVPFKASPGPDAGSAPDKSFAGQFGRAKETIGINLKSNAIRGYASARSVTPAFAKAASAWTALPFTALVHIPAKAIRYRLIPDFDPVFEHLQDGMIYGAESLDQTIQGAISTIKAIDQSATANLDWDQASVNYTLQEWPPFFQLKTRYDMFAIEIARTGTHVAMNLLNSTTLSNPRVAFNTTNMYNYILEMGTLGRETLDVLFTDAKISYLQRSGYTVQTMALVVAETMTWVKDALVESVYGEVETDFSAAKFSHIVARLNQQFQVRVVGSLRMLAGAFGIAFDYNVDPITGIPETNYGGSVGCILFNGVNTVADLLNATFVSMELVFVDKDYENFIFESTQAFLPMYSDLFALGRCGAELVEEIAELVNVEPGVCNINRARSNAHAMTYYPLQAHADQCVILGAQSICMQLAAPQVIRLFETAMCGNVSLIDFGATASSEVTFGHSTASTAQCHELAAALQTIFHRDCATAWFDPENMFCNLGYLVQSIIHTVIVTVKGFADILAAVLARLGQNSVGVSTVELPWPTKLWDGFYCGLGKTLGDVVGTALGIITDLIDGIIDAVVGHQAGTISNQEYTLKRDEVETAVASLLYTGLAAPPLIFVNITGSTIKSFFESWNVAVEEIGGEIGCKKVPGNGNQYTCNSGDSNLIVKTVVSGLNAMLDWPIGVAEGLQAVFQTAKPIGADPSANPLRPLVLFFNDIILLMDALRLIIDDLVRFIFLLGKMLFATIAFLVTDGVAVSPVEMAGIMVDSIAQIFAMLINLAEGLAQMTYSILAQIPKFGKILVAIMHVGCMAINIAIDAVNGLISMCDGLKFLGVSCPSQASAIQCANPAYLKAAIPAPVATQCIVNAACNYPKPSSTAPISTEPAGSTCVDTQGNTVWCTSECAANIFGCNTIDFTCECGTPPTAPKPCTNNNATMCEANDICLVTSTIGGPDMGTVRCGTCANVHSASSTQCASSKGYDIDNPTDTFCQCALKSEPFVDHHQYFGATCDSLAIGDACDPISSDGYAVAVRRDLDITTFAPGMKPLNGTDIMTVAIGSIVCNIAGVGGSGGRCAETRGLYYPKTCVCQAFHDVAPSIASFNRRLLVDGAAAQSSSSSFDPFQEFDAVRHGDATHVSKCDSDADCQDSWDTCLTDKPFKLTPCSACSLQKTAADSDGGVCDLMSRRCFCPLSKTSHHTTSNTRSAKQQRQHFEKGWATNQMDFRTDAMLFRRLAHMAPWDGMSWCDITMRSMKLGDSFENTTSTAASPQAAANMEYCMHQRLLAFVMNEAAGSTLGLPADFFYNVFSVVRFGRDWLVSMGVSLTTAMFPPGNGNDDPSMDDIAKVIMHRLVDEFDIEPDHALMWAHEWVHFWNFMRYEFSVVEHFGSASKLVDDWVQHVDSPVEMRDNVKPGRAHLGVMAKLARNSAQQTSTRIVPVLRNMVTNGPRAMTQLHEFTTNVTKNTHNRRRRNAHAAAAAAAPVKGLLTPKGVAVLEKHTTAALEPVKFHGRRLMSFGSWIYEEVTDCAILRAINDTIVRGADILVAYYGTNLPASVKRLTSFNITGTKELQPGDQHVVTGWKHLSDLFQTQRIANVWNKLSGKDEDGIKAVEVLDTIIDFATCSDAKSITLCTTNRGIVNELRFLIVMFALIGFFLYFVFPQSLFVVGVVFVMFVPILLYNTYGYSMACLPMIPGCLAGDLWQVWATMKPRADPVFFVTMVNVWLMNGLSISECMQAPYDFNTIFSNIAYTMTQNGVLPRDHVSITLQGFFPEYDTSTTDLATFQMCNYITWLHNGGWTVLILSAVSTVIILAVAAVRLYFSTVMVVLSSTYTCTEIYNNGSSLPPPPPPQAVPPVQQQQQDADTTGINASTTAMMKRPFRTTLSHPPVLVV